MPDDIVSKYFHWILDDLTYEERSSLIGNLLVRDNYDTNIKAMADMIRGVVPAESYADLAAAVSDGPSID